MNLQRTIEDILIDEGLITPEELTQALSRTDASSDVDSGVLLVRMGVITEYQRLKCVGLGTGIPFFDLRERTIPQAVADRLSHSMTLKYRALVVEVTESAASVAMVNPLDFDAIDEIRAVLGVDVDPLWVVEADLLDAIQQIYGTHNELEDIVLEASRDLEGSGLELSKVDGEDEPSVNAVELREVAAGGPIIQLANALFIRAIKLRASDIHIEPRAKTVMVRFRIDGIMCNIMETPREIYRALVSRVKVLSGLDIAERRLPQDGRCTLSSAEGQFDFRVATYPSVFGEKVTIRVLDRRGANMDVFKLGIEPHSLNDLLKASQQSQGLILVTGPTGSGKSTTLYSLLNYLNSPERHIITIEDPVEYQLNGIVQGNVNVAAGITFAKGLRAMLRADPDIVLVGESRDPETAKTSIEAALTGHLVLTSLHANDCTSAVTRLIEMGVEPFLVSASVTCSVAQRLVRVNCPNCSAPYTPSTAELDALGLTEDDEYMRGTGCERCSNTGYRGRMGVYEILPIGNQIRGMILQGASAMELRQHAIASGFRSMRTDGLSKVLSGVTTAQEILRVVAEEAA